MFVARLGGRPAIGPGLSLLWAEERPQRVPLEG